MFNNYEIPDISFSVFVLIACESESVDDLRPTPVNQPVVMPNDTTGTDTTGTDTTATGPTISFARDIKPLIETKCAISGCHAANFNFPTLENYTQIEQNKSRVNANVQSGSMPQNGPLPQNQKDLIQTWINEGALNN